MYFTGEVTARRVPVTRPRARVWRRWDLAADSGIGYDAGGAAAPNEPAAGPSAGPIGVAELRARGVAVEGLADALALAEVTADALAGVGLDAEADTTIADAAVGLQRQANRLAGAHLGVLAQAERREVYRADGAVTLASWLRARTHMDPADAAALCTAAVRVHDHLPALRAALEAGDTSLRHVLPVTAACIPARAAAIAHADEALTAYACDLPPTAVRRALRRLTACVDPDGTDNPEQLPEGPRDARRDLYLHATIDGLWDLKATLDAATGEKLAALLDAFDTPDAAKTPPGQQRTPAQRRHDALDDLLTRALGLPDLPEVHGRPPHVLVMIDLLALAALIGILPEEIRDHIGDRPPARMRYTGAISPAMALHLLATAAITLVQTEGPWRPVNVGRQMRTLPPYLRDILHMLHMRCRGPDCDRWVTWTDAHHLKTWTADHANTDLNDTIPVCKAHHKLCDQGWTATLDTTTGTTTWTTPTGHTITVHP